LGEGERAVGGAEGDGEAGAVGVGDFEGIAGGGGEQLGGVLGGGLAAGDGVGRRLGGGGGAEVEVGLGQFGGAVGGGVFDDQAGAVVEPEGGVVAADAGVAVAVVGVVEQVGKVGGGQWGAAVEQADEFLALGFAVGAEIDDGVGVVVEVAVLDIDDEDVVAVTAF
jgi:hypothetical protein